MGEAADPLHDPETLLLVEDELIERMYAADLLEQAGYRVLEAANADLALQVLEADPRAVSVLVTDVHMPGSIDGCDLAQIVDERWPWIRIVMTSAEANMTSEDVPDHGLFVPKPWPEAAMLNAVGKAGHVGHGAQNGT